MSTGTDRDRVLAMLLQRARDDHHVQAAALTGSLADGGHDRWSDIDLVLGVDDDIAGDVTDDGSAAPLVARTAQAWTAWLVDHLDAVHHWDLPVEPDRVVRVFLLPGGLEVDLTFAPAEQFGPRGPQWRTVFGVPQDLPPFLAADPVLLIGLGWHHLMHAQVCLHRGLLWQAEHWISATRGHLITLACSRLGHRSDHAKGAHLLPEALSAALQATLVGDLSSQEVQRALSAATGAYLQEVRQVDPALASRLVLLLPPTDVRGDRSAV